MSKQLVTVRVPVPAGFDGGDLIQVYTDWGGGSIDTSKPLLARPYDPFGGAERARSIGRQPVGRGKVGGRLPARKRRGVGRGRLGVTAVGKSPA